MREIAHISIRGDFAARKALEVTWNAAHETKWDYALVIDKAHPEYAQVRPFVEQFFRGRASAQGWSWHEWVDVKYTGVELRSFPLLELCQVGDAGEGNNTYAPVYRAEVLCQGCGRRAFHQERNLVLDLLEEEPDAEEVGYFQHDFCVTNFGETVVSQRVKDLLEAHQVPGVQLRRVEHCDPAVARPELPAYYQLLIESEIGPLLERGTVVRRNPCAQCGEFQEVLYRDPWAARGRELYFARSSYGGAWIMTYGFGAVSKLDSGIIVSQQLFRLLQEKQFTGFYVQPVHLVD